MSSLAQVTTDASECGAEAPVEASTPSRPCSEIQSCNWPRRLTRPMRIAFDRCGIRCTGRGIVTSATVWVRKASHSSPSRKIRTPTRSRSLLGEGLAGGVPGVLLAVRPATGSTRPGNPRGRDGRRRREPPRRRPDSCGSGRASRARGSFGRPRSRSGSSNWLHQGEDLESLRVCFRGIAHLMACSLPRLQLGPLCAAAKPGGRGGVPAPLRDQGQGEQGLVMPGVKINRFVEHPRPAALWPLPG